MKTQLPYAFMKYALAQVLLMVVLTTVVIASPLRDKDIVMNAAANSLPATSVSGKVVDESGQGIPGVNILEKGTTNGTSTDVDGKFTLNVQDASSVLVFSFIGYKTTEIPVGGQTEISVTLNADVNNLEEVVVVGYGIQKKASLTGAVADVGSKTLNAVAVGDATQRLQGRIAGVTVTNNNAPGAVATVRVRGYGSVASNISPLYVIDGIPRTTMDNINPNDIESMTVLKDASSSAIYGSRAANGVILITTKAGKEGKTKLTFDTRVGVQNKTNRPDLMNSSEIGQLLWQRNRNNGVLPGQAAWGNVQYGTGLEPVVPDYVLPAFRQNGTVDENTYSYPNPYNAITRANKGDFDWYDAVFAPAPVQEYNLSVSGGNNGSNYAISGGYLNQLGIVNYEGDDINAATKNGFKRYSLRMNADLKVNDWLKIGPRLSATYGNQRGTVDPGIVNTTLTMHPILPLYDIRGNFAGSKVPGTGNGNNPVAALVRNNNDYIKSMIVQGSMYAQATILKSLILRSTVGVSYNSANQLDRTLMNPEFNQAQLIDRLDRTSSFQYQWNWTNTINYTKTINDAHNFNVLVGTEAIDRRVEMLMGSRSGYAKTNLDFMTLSAGERDVVNAGNFDQSRLFSYFGRINYDYKGKYLFEAVVRRDASSRFIGDYRWGTFPAFSAGWRIKDEAFMDNVSWVDDLKLRAGWGVNGNDNVGDYNAYDTYIANGQESYYNITGANRTSAVAGFHKSYYGNSLGRWETNVATNVGIDASLFQGKIDLTVDMYSRRTTDMLYPDQRPATWAQVNLPNINIGEMRNRGIDIMIGHRGQINSDFRYNVSVNASHFRNEVVRLNNNPNEQRFTNPIEANFNTVSMAGHPLNSFFGYQVDGIFNTAEEVAAHPKAFPNIAGVDTYSRPGVFKFRDVNGDGVINTGDRTFIGDGYPDLSYGLNIDLNYKNFDFSVFGQGVVGRDVINNAKRVMLFIRNDGNYLRERLYESWTPERYAAGEKITLPITINNDANMQLPSSFFVEKGDYFRLKNIQLGYTLPRNILDKLKLNGLRVYVQASNVFTITKYTGLDVEVNDTGIGDTVYPTARVLMGGLNFDF